MISNPHFLKIGVVIEMMQSSSDNKFARESWDAAAGTYIALYTPPDPLGKDLPFIYLVTAQGDRVPWVPSQIDLLAEDWYMLD